MAILNGIIKKMNGSVGSLTFKTVGGRTVVSEKITATRNNRTGVQQRQRMKWANIVKMYSGIAPLLRNGFEKKGAHLSDYNMFVKLNNACTPVYLSKAEADGGGCIAAPYLITRGSLPSIVVSGAGADSQTDIRLGSLVIDADTTVAQFSLAVVSNNADYEFGDQISFFDIAQKMNAETHIPYCQFAASAVILDKSSQVKLWNLVSKTGFTSVASTSADGSYNGMLLAHGMNEGDGCFAWVHSSYQSGVTRVSTQYLIDNNSLLADYTSSEAYSIAVNSYGGVNNMFLTPTAGSIQEQTTGDGGIGTPEITTVNRPALNPYQGLS